MTRKKQAEPAPMSEQDLAEQARALENARVQRATEAINGILKKERCALLPSVTIVGNQISQKIDIVPAQ